MMDVYKKKCFSIPSGSYPLNPARHAAIPGADFGCIGKIITDLLLTKIHMPMRN
jgi:hypothetical protein